MKRTNTWLAWALVVGLLAFMLGSATASRGKVNEAQPVFGFATGSALHLDALQAGLTGPRVADAELAFSSANVNSQGFPATSGVNEMNVNLQPPADHFTPNKSFSGKAASARGAGLQLGLGSDVPTNAGEILSETEAGAIAPPPDSEVHDAGIGDTLAPIAYASLLHTEANATWLGTGNPCTSSISSPISFGRGYAADAQLLNAGGSNPDGSFQAPVVATDDPNPARSVVQSRSFTYAIPNGDPGKFGLVSEIHQTFAPITIGRGTLPAIEIEVLGEWVFKATATGKLGGAKIEYYALDDATGTPVTPTTPVLRISMDGGLTFTSLNAQDVFGNGGLVLPLAPLASIALGEDPRAIAPPNSVPDATSSPTQSNGPTGQGRLAFGAVDVVRLSTLDVALGTHLEDLRIGHFEAAVGVPDGGFSCTPDTTTTAPTTSTSTTSSTTTSTSTTSTTLAPTTTTTSTTLAPTTTTTSTTIPGSTTTVAPTTSTSAAPTTSTTNATTTTSTPPNSNVANAIAARPNTVG